MTSIPTPDLLANPYGITRIPMDMWNSNMIMDCLFCYRVQQYETTLERRNFRSAFCQTIGPLVYRVDIIDTIIGVNPFLVQYFPAATTNQQIKSIISDPGLIAIIPTDKFSKDDWELLCHHHQWIYNQFYPIDLSIPHHVHPNDNGRMMEVPNYVLYQTLSDRDGSWETDIQNHPLLHKDPIKKLDKLHKHSTTLTQQDVCDSAGEFEHDLLNAIHASDINISKRITNNPHQLVEDPYYNTLTFSISVAQSVDWFGRDITDKLVEFRKRIPPMRCSYDADTIVLGWSRYTLTPKGVLIDELQSDIKRPLKGSFPNAILNKIEYHILVQSIKVLYDEGVRDVYMPTWKQRSELYRQIPGTQVPRDPYVYIPRRVGFTEVLPNGLHYKFDGTPTQYLDLRM